MERASVLTICVNYQNDEETIAFIRSVLRQEGDLAQTVIVVDNTVPPRVDSPLRRASESDERICVLYPDRNLGYFRGAAWGLRKYTDQFGGLPEWVIVSNPDIELIQPDFLSNLSKFHSSTTHAVIAPAIYSRLSRRDLNPHMKARPSRRRMRFYKALFRFYPLSICYHVLAFVKSSVQREYGRLRSTANSIVKPTANRRRQAAQPEQIYAPHGSFVVLNRRYFEGGGNLDHGTFLCGEELFIAETARRLGLPVVYDPRLGVAHNERTPLRRGMSRQLLAFVREAASYVADTFFIES